MLKLYNVIYMGSGTLYSVLYGEFEIYSFWVREFLLSFESHAPDSRNTLELCKAEFWEKPSPLTETSQLWLFDRHTFTLERSPIHKLQRTSGVQRR